MSQELKFGTSGLRALATDLDRKTCIAYTRAFLSLVDKRLEGDRTLCIGMDLRPSSAEIAGWCAEAAVATGFTVINGGLVPTPAIARYALMRSLPALMITASHNPVEYNGIKFYKPDGELMKDDEAPIKALLDLSTPLPPPSHALPPVTEGVANEYADSFKSLFPRGSLAGLKLGVDQHSAVGRDLLLRILEAAGAECIVVRRSSKFIAVDTEALPDDYLALARNWLEDGQFDAIVSTDGDGDRPLVIDEGGVQILGDVLGILAAHHLGYSTLVTPISSTSAIEECGWFTSISRTRIGSPFVIDAMREALHSGVPRVAGFEGNGGFLTGGTLDWRGHSVPELMTRDAILPMLAVLQAAREAKLPLSRLVATLPPRAKATGRLADVDVARAKSWIDTLVASPQAREAALPALAQTSRIETMDGAKFLLRDGSSLHFRLSGNAPELRCYVESGDAERSNLALKAALETARAAIG